MKQNINKEAFEQAEKELLDGKVKEIKGYILKTLEKIEDKKKEKERVEDELRILKLDLNDLRNGKFDKIEERIEKSETARNVTVIQRIHSHSASSVINTPTYNYTTSGDWQTLTSGTYNTSDGNTFYF